MKAGKFASNCPKVEVDYALEWPVKALIIVVQRMVRCSASRLGILLFVSLSLQACGSISTARQGRDEGLASSFRKETSGGRAQRLAALPQPRKADPYFGSVTAFVVHVNVAADEKARRSGDWISEEEAAQRLTQALNARGVRVAEPASASGRHVAYVNLSLELSTAPEARRYGYRLAVTDESVDPSMAFDQSVKAYLRDRRAGSISVGGQGGKAADLGLIDGIADDVVKLVPKAKREEPKNLLGESESMPKEEPGAVPVDCFVIRTRFEFDPTLTARRGYWTAGSAKAYLEKLLRDRGLSVVDAPERSTGSVAYVDHWIKGKAKEGADGFDYRYESSYSVMESGHPYLPNLDSHDKGVGEFGYFEDSERMDLEKFADDLARAYRDSRQAR
jgi:hypothetical protein